MCSAPNTVILPKDITDSMIQAYTEEIPGAITILPGVLLNIITTLKHARTFISTKQRMHSTGIELYDELVIFLENLGKEQEL